MKIQRTWAMPNKETFKIKPIANLLNKYVKNLDWIDPFAGNSNVAYFTNDLNPETKAKEHLRAEDFIKKHSNMIHTGCLFDPPYSLRQIKECYDNIGVELSHETSKYLFTKLKDKISNIIVPGGYVISFGWSSVGFGKKRGFEIVEILLVCHGGHHNDTIVVVEKKVQSMLKR